MNHWKRKIKTTPPTQNRNSIHPPQKTKIISIEVVLFAKYYPLIKNTQPIIPAFSICIMLLNNVHSRKFNYFLNLHFFLYLKKYTLYLLSFHKNKKIAMQKNDDMFRRERELLDRFELVYKSNIYDFDELMNEYFALGKAYRKMLKQTKKLVSISDRTQKELFNTRAELQIQYDYIDNELKRAAEHVKSLLPAPYFNESISIDWRYEPSSRLGGDIFGYQFFDKNRIAIYLVDVCGHGIGPALHSVSVLNTIKFRTLPRTDFLNPASVLTSLNKAFSMFDHNNLFCTMWYCIYDFASKEIRISGAGHPPIIRILNDSDIVLFKSTNPPIGTALDYEYKYDTLSCGNGAELYLYTDGVYEVKNNDGKYMQFNDFVDFLVKNNNNDILNDIYNHALNYSYNNSLEDDFTVMKIVTK